MNIAELRAILVEAGIPEDVYSLTGGLPNEAYCIEQGPDGRWYGYYSERGGKSGLRAFESEDAACREMLDSMKFDNTLPQLRHDD